MFTLRHDAGASPRPIAIARNATNLAGAMAASLTVEHTAITALDASLGAWQHNLEKTR